MRLFADFYKADIIVASPIALVADRSQDTSHDFLSSIEIVIVDRADVFTMQNWAHIVAGPAPPTPFGLCPWNTRMVVSQDPFQI